MSNRKIDGYEGLLRLLEEMRDGERDFFKLVGSITDENGHTLSDDEACERYIRDPDFARMTYRNGHFMLMVIRGNDVMNQVRKSYQELESASNIDLSLADKFTEMTEQYKSAHREISKMLTDWTIKGSEKRWKAYSQNRAAVNKTLEPFGLKC